MTYKPEHIDASHIELPNELKELVETLAKCSHDKWASQRIKEGWSWGPERNDHKKETPDLVPYEDLPEREKAYDRIVVISTLKTIMALGYRIIATQ